MHYYEVAPTRVVMNDKEVFTYESAVSIEIGTVVLIPVGKKLVTGVVMKKARKPEFATRPIERILDEYPLPKRLLAAAKWMSDYYATPLGLVWQAILPRGLEKKRRESVNTAARKNAPRNIPLNKHQLTVLKQVKNISKTSILLHGITGSGKTHIYLSLIDEVLHDKKSAIVLVPEIALTSQVNEVFTKYFGSKVIVLHSGQTEAERHILWQKILSATEPVVVVGPRSALFAPIKNLGIIVVDEAHEGTYKQEQSPKYNALRVATIMAKADNIKVVFGTATPLVSEYFLAKKYGAVVELKHSAVEDAKKPEIIVVDMKDKTQFRKHRFFSDVFLQQIQQSLSEKKQVLVFHNRRGSAIMTVCDGCGWQALCKDCFLPLTLHSDTYQLMCHSCGKVYKMANKCPECGGVDILHKGIGTKLIENELGRLFPKAVIARFDGDTPNSQSAVNLYEKMHSGKIDIIIGTQMIAKGFDLPHLGLVGIVQADMGLSLPDFSSNERVFQLLAQAIGRVGRGNGKTRVVLQSFIPDSVAVKFGVAQDYEKFYDYEIRQRKKGLFPPFCFLLKLTCNYKTEASCIKNAKEMASSLKKIPNIEVFGPMPAFHEQTAQGFKWQIVVKNTTRESLKSIMTRPLGAHWQYDLDPSTLL